jgi:hypothetical protein
MIDVTIINAIAGTGSLDASLPTIIAGQTGTISSGSLALQVSNISITSDNDIQINDMAGAPTGGTILLTSNVNFSLTSNNGNITALNTSNVIQCQGTGTISLTTVNTSGLDITSCGLTTANQSITIFSDHSLTNGSASINSGSGSLTFQANQNIGAFGAPFLITTTGAQTSIAGGGGWFIENTAVPSSANVGTQFNDLSNPSFASFGGLVNKLTYSTSTPPVLSTSGVIPMNLTFEDAGGGCSLGTINTGTNSLEIATVAAITDASSNIICGDFLIAPQNTGGIGTLAAPIRTNISGSLTTSAPGGIYIVNSGPLSNLTVVAYDGVSVLYDVNVSCVGNMGDAGGTVAGLDVTLTATGGVIGTNASPLTIAGGTFTLAPGAEIGGVCTNTTGSLGNEANPTILGSPAGEGIFNAACYYNCPFFPVVGSGKNLLMLMGAGPQ